MLTATKSATLFYFSNNGVKKVKKLYCEI
jgi:hypothetical protein